MPPIFATNFIQDAFSPLISVFKAIMVFLHGNVTGGSWGLAIIGLTIVVRAALVPLTVKQFSSMAKLQALGPEIKALQARHKDDKQRLNEEMMKFYRENQVNPFSSCLPLVLQLPVFLSLFYMLRSDLKLQICGAQLHAHHILSDSMIQSTSCQSVSPGSGKFLFIPDITASAHNGVLAILIVLYIGSQLISSLMTTATVDRNQRLIALGLPFVFTIFIISFPAGLILYWITTNLWTVGQQYVVRRYFPPPNMVAGAGGLSLSSLWNRGDGDAQASPKPRAGATTGGRSDRPPGRAAGKVKTTSGEGAAVLGKGAAAGKGAPAGKGTTVGKGTAAGKGGATAGKGAAAGKGRATAGKGAAAVASPAKEGSSRRATTAAAGKKDSGAASNGRGTGTEPLAKDEGGAAKKPAPTTRSRGAAPPPPPRKKKKRSGRRR